MAFIGLIPARGGSKGIPDKNVAPCAGKPLLAWTCEAARSSERLGETIVSTDSETIARVARDWGMNVPFRRPAELAGDTTPSIDVLLHCLDWLQSEGRSITAIVLLQPTSPLRTHSHIDAAVEAFTESRADTLVSVVEVPHSFQPESLVVERDGWLEPYQGRQQTIKRRQDVPPLFARNGPAILIVRPEILRSGSMYGERTRAFPMSPAESIDVDTPFDLEIAALLLSRRTVSCAE